MDDPVYVACLKLTEQPVLVVGGGPIATGKAEGLIASGARVTVVAREVSAGMERLAAAGRIALIERAYTTEDLDGRLLVVASTDDPELHAKIHADATDRKMLVNVVDVPELCNFIVPALHRTGPITFAISTAGASPALAKRMRDQVSSMFGEAWGRLADRLRDERAWSREHLPTYADRQAFFESIVLGDPDPISLLEAGEIAALDDLIERRRTEILAALPQRP